MDFQDQQHKEKGGLLAALSFARLEAPGKALMGDHLSLGCGEAAIADR